MDAFAPEFFKHWMVDPVQEEAAAGTVAADEAREQAALEALVERVSAARLVM